MKKTEAQIRAEARADYEKELAAKAAQAKRNRNTFTKVMNDFEADFKKFDWKQERTALRPWDGTLCRLTDKHHEAYKVQSAIGTLARATFRVKSAAGIPSGNEEQLRQITRKLLDIVLSEITAKPTSAV